LGPCAISGPHSRSELNADVRKRRFGRVWHFPALSPPGFRHRLMRRTFLYYILAQLSLLRISIYTLSIPRNTIGSRYIQSGRQSIEAQYTSNFTPKPPSPAYCQARSSFHITTMSTQPLLQRTQKKVSHYRILEDHS
jgi:hypothetical protein